MKTILTENRIELEAENFADKLYLYHFLKACKENKIYKDIDTNFSYSDSRMAHLDDDTPPPQGGGYFDVKEVVPTLFDAENAYLKGKHRIAIEEIESISFINYEL